MEKTEKREQTLHEMMQKLAEQTEDFPADKKDQLAKFLEGVLYAVSLMKEQTA